MCIAKGDLEVARCASRRLTEIAADKTKTIVAHAETAAGRLALTEGDAAGARARLERAIDLFSEHNLPHEAARARVVFAQALVPADAELAREVARAASTAFIPPGRHQRCSGRDGATANLTPDRPGA